MASLPHGPVPRTSSKLPRHEGGERAEVTARAALRGASAAAVLGGASGSSASQSLLFSSNHPPIETICAIPLKFPLPLTVKSVTLSAATLPETERDAPQPNPHPGQPGLLPSRSGSVGGELRRGRGGGGTPAWALPERRIGLLLPCGPGQTIRVT